MKTKIRTFHYTITLLIVLLQWSYSNAQFVLNGDAILTGTANVYRLTPELDSKSGAIWYNKMCDLSEDFTIEARINVGDNSGASNGADGMTFTFQKSCLNAGGGNQGLGAWGIDPSLVIEFDTWRNTSQNDPLSTSGNDHISFFKNGILTHGSSNELSNTIGSTPRIVSDMENGAWKEIKIVWDADSNYLDLFYINMTAPIYRYEGNLVDSIFNGSPYVYWGFTAATGAENNLHRVEVTTYPDNVVHLDSITACAGQSFTTGLPGFGNYEWWPNDGTINDTSLAYPTFSPIVDQWYYLRYTDTCSNSNPFPISNSSITLDSFYVTVVPTPSVTLPTPPLTSICPGQTINLNANFSGSGTFEWLKDSVVISGATTASYTANDTGQYHVVLTNASGCSDTSNAINITPAIGPSASIAVNSDSICSGDQTTFTTSTSIGETIQWLLDGATISGETNTTLLASTAGLYTVEITDANGCSDVSSSISLTVVSPPNAVINASALNFCPGVTNINLSSSSSGTFTYQWYMNGSIISGATNATYSATATGDYSVEITNAFGCSDTSATTTLGSSGVGTFTTSAPNDSICPGDNVTISTTLENGSTYTWYNGTTVVSGSTLNQNSYTASTAGNYYAVIENAAGCSTHSDTTNISVLPAPMVTLSATTTGICAGDSTNLLASFVSGASYEWFKNGTSLGAPVNGNNSINVSDGMYYVVANDGCETTSNTISVSIIPVPGAAGSITGATSFCPGSSFNYSISNVTNASSYNWTISPTGAASIGSGQGTNSVLVNTTNQAFTINVTPVNGCGQGASNSKSVSLESSFICSGNVMFAANKTNVCLTETVVFTDYTDPTSFPGFDASWDFGPGASPATATGSGPHSVTYSTGGMKTVVLTYTEPFTLISYSENKNNYIQVTGSVNTSVISGPTNVSCASITETYSVVNTPGSSYDWTVPTGAAITSGQGTDQIQVNLNGNDGTISVIETNTAGCIGSSVNTTISITGLPDTSVSHIATGLPSLLANQTGANYQWIDCDNGFAIIAGETNQSFVPSSNGNYAVIVNLNGCIDTSNCHNVDNVLGVETIKSSTDIHIYPNPSDGLIKIESSRYWDKGVIDIFDATGKLYQTIDIEGETFNIFIPDRGIYFLVLKDRNEVFTKRIIIQ